MIAGAITDMRIRSEGAAEAESSAEAQAVGCKHSGRERFLGITASWSHLV